MPLPRVLEPEIMSSAEEAGEYDAMDFSATDQLFADRAAALGRGARWIFDIGSGNAKIPLAIGALMAPTTQICAVEMSVEMLAAGVRNRSRAGAHDRRLLFLRADAKRLPLPDACAELVTSNSLVHHIPDPRAVFREIARIVRPGGSILIRDLVRPESEEELARLVDRHAAGSSPLQRRLFSDSLRAALTPSEVRDVLGECGLAGVSVTQITDRHWSAERSGIKS
jgi:ubiquinone/menaquinone biosynthesis C-methylase UbiE